MYRWLIVVEISVTNSTHGLQLAVTLVNSRLWFKWWRHSKQMIHLISLNKYVVRLIINQGNYCLLHNMIVSLFGFMALVCKCVVPKIEKILLRCCLLINKFAVSCIIRSFMTSRFTVSSYSLKVLADIWAEFNQLSTSLYRFHSTTICQQFRWAASSLIKIIMDSIGFNCFNYLQLIGNQVSFKFRCHKLETPINVGVQINRYLTTLLVKWTVPLSLRYRI